MQSSTEMTYLLAESLVCEGLDPMSQNYSLGQMTDASMEPVIPEGAVIGIDYRPAKVRQGVPYYIDYNGQSGIRFVEPLHGGGMKLRSASPDHEDVTLGFGDILKLTVFGRVFYWEAWSASYRDSEHTRSIARDT